MLCSATLVIISIPSFSSVCILRLWNFKLEHQNMNIVRPRDTQPQDARTLQEHVFELGPKKFELNKFM